LAGAVVGEAQRQRYYASQPAYYYPATTYAQPGYGYIYAPPYAYTPVYAPAPPRPNYAVGGTLLGALAGGLIGVGTDHGWEGAGPRGPARLCTRDCAVPPPRPCATASTLRHFLNLFIDSRPPRSVTSPKIGEL